MLIVVLFQGVGLSFYGQIDHDQSTFTDPVITLDGEAQTFTLPTREVSAIDPDDPWWNSNYFSVDSLESKKHTLVVSAGNDRPIWLDYILIKPGTPSGENVSANSGISSGAIAGIVIGSVLGLALVAGALIFWWRRKRATRAPSQEYEYHGTVYF